MKKNLFWALLLLTIPAVAQLPSVPTPGNNLGVPQEYSMQNTLQSWLTFNVCKAAADGYEPLSICDVDYTVSDSRCDAWQKANAYPIKYWGNGGILFADLTACKNAQYQFFEGNGINGGTGCKSKVATIQSEIQMNPPGTRGTPCTDFVPWAWHLQSWFTIAGAPPKGTNIGGGCVADDSGYIICG